MHGGPVVRAPCAATAMRVKRNPEELSEQERVKSSSVGLRLHVFFRPTDLSPTLSSLSQGHALRTPPSLRGASAPPPRSFSAGGAEIFFGICQPERPENDSVKLTTAVSSAELN